MQRIIRIFLTLSLLPLLMLWSAPQALAQESGPQIRITQVDKSNFPQVTVYVSVVNEAGEPVGVDPSTIQISENGQMMEPTNIQGGGNAAAEVIPVTSMLVMDISGSMDKNGKLDAAKDAAKTYVNQMRPSDQAGLITYDTQTYYVQTLTTDIAALTSAIDGLQTGGDTAMYNALMEAEVALESVSGRKAIIVLTDGLDNKSQSTSDDVIATISQSGLTISAIGFGDAGSTGQVGLDEAGLKSLTERSGGLYGFAEDAETLSAIYQQYGQALQSEYAFTYLSPSTLRDGVNRGLTVSLNGNAASTTEQYNPGGVLPEVAARSWPLFLMILVGLLVLLIVPSLLNRGIEVIGAMGKKDRVKMNQMPASSAKGRVKMK